MITEARHRGIAIAEDANLTASLYRQDIDTPIHVGLFGPVAAAIRRSGVLDNG
jgi:type III secretion system FlhB-like substrate exporter